MIKRFKWNFAAGVLVMVFVVAVVQADSGPPREGERLPDFEIPVPADAVHRNYLGIIGEETFKVPQINARVVIIEIFSMY